MQHQNDRPRRIYSSGTGFLYRSRSGHSGIMTCNHLLNFQCEIDLKDLKFYIFEIPALIYLRCFTMKNDQIDFVISDNRTVFTFLALAESKITELKGAGPVF